MSEALAVLVVDQNHRNQQLLAQVLSREGYDVRPAHNLAEFDAVLATPGQVRIGLLDITGFDSQIWSRCEQMRAARIPFLVLSSRQSTALQMASLAHGASSVVSKPLAIRDLLGLIRLLPESRP